MTAERTFPTEDEIDREMASHRIAPESLAEQDQHMAAMSETWNKVHESVDQLQADGVPLEVTSGADMTLEQANLVERNAMRMLLGAQSVGIRSMCPHTNEIRPLVICCNPPIVACLDCVGNIPDPPPYWLDECDGCGARTKNLIGYQVTVSNLVIWGDVCKNCSDQTKI
jgi:hypothetical protein